MVMVKRWVFMMGQQLLLWQQAHQRVIWVFLLLHMVMQVLHLLILQLTTLKSKLVFQQVALLLVSLLNPIQLLKQVNHLNSVLNTTFNLPTWSTVITAVSIPSTIAVYGNGKTLGLTNGTNNFGLRQTTSYFRGAQNIYGTNVGDTSSATGLSSDGISYGVTTDTSGKSGIVAKSNSITRISKSFNFCIKY